MQGAFEHQSYPNWMLMCGDKVFISPLNFLANFFSSSVGTNATAGQGKWRCVSFVNPGMMQSRNLFKVGQLKELNPGLPIQKSSKFGQSVGTCCHRKRLTAGRSKWVHWSCKSFSKGLSVSKSLDHSPRQQPTSRLFSCGKNEEASIAEIGISAVADGFISMSFQITKVSTLLHGRKWLKSTVLP